MEAQRTQAARAFGKMAEKFFYGKQIQCFIMRILYFYFIKIFLFQIKF